MLVPGRGPQALCFCILALACVVARQQDASAATPSPPLEPEGSPWSLVKDKVKALVTRTREKWQRLWGPEALPRFMQAYYDDHLKDLSLRTQAWLRSSRDSLLTKAHSLCPQLLCGDSDKT